MTLVGVIVSGGRSRRFGSEKAMAQIAGGPLIAQCYDVLANACEAVAINAPVESATAAWARGLTLAVVPDLPGMPRGPLSGLCVGLEWAAAQGASMLATSPCDTPWLPSDLVDRLVAALTPDAGAAIAACGAELHPICAVWRVNRAPVVRAVLDAGRHPPVRELAESLNATVAEFADPRAFANVNTVDELAQYLGNAAIAGSRAS
jgi:molybdopterin-guanine dinucleotide biosynthesis protein A